MTLSVDNESERRRLERIAADYQSQGYDVKIQPQPADLPAALLLLWSATEGALRLLASRENVVLKSLAPAYVVNRLYVLGLLGREQYQTLHEMMRLRNQAAHGFQVAVTSEDLSGISTVLKELINEVEAKAA